MKKKEVYEKNMKKYEEKIKTENYNIPYSENFEILNPLQNLKVTYIDVVDKMHDKTYFFDDKDLEKLLTAIKKDMLSYSYENIVTTSSPLMEIHLSYEYYSYMEESTEYNQLTFRVYDDCVNTMNTLKDIGFYEETDTE